MDLIAGATGNVGSEVVEQLLTSGREVRVFTRDPARAARWEARVQVAMGDFQEPDTFERAVTGVDAVFLIHQTPDRETFRKLIAAAKAAGNPRIVFQSTLLADRPEFRIGVMHKEKEDLIRESGLACKFIRPGGFMSNCYQWAGSIKAQGLVYNPMGEGKSAPIAPEDIAAVAVKALTEPGLTNEVFELTGGELLTVPEQVDILARVLGKAIRCIDIPVEAAIQNMVRAGVPQSIASGVAQSFEAVRDGRGGILKDTFQRAMGRRPLTFEAWARKHASRFA